MPDLLKNKKCVPCESNVARPGETEINDYLSQLPDWKVEKVNKNGTKVDTLNRKYSFKNFIETMSFLNRVADLAESERHHPDFCVKYKFVEFSLWTHTVNGLHENDFILASKINEIAKSSTNSDSNNN